MVKIVTQNVRGLRNNIKRKNMFYFLREKADIICMQETHSCESDVIQWQLEWGNKIYWSHGTTSSKGTAILIKKNTEIEVCDDFSDKCGRMVGIKFKYKEAFFVLVNIYAPNEDDPQYFIEQLKSFEDNTGHRILCGDFNLVMDVDVDRTGSGANNNVKSLDILDKYMEDTMMCDIWRVRNGEARTYTFTRNESGIKRYIGSRLDMFLLDMSISSWVQHVKIFPKFKSDHAPVVLDILPFNIKRGKGVWKLNNRVLYEEEYVQMINQKIEEIKNCSKKTNPQERWESLKIAIIANSQMYCNERSLNRNLIINQLEQYVQNMESKNVETYNDAEINCLNRSREDLNKFREEKVQGAIFRTKARWYNESEASTAYFYGLEKSRAGAKNMNALLLDNGDLVTNPNIILEHQRNFYKKLYTSDHNVEFDYVNESNIKLTNEVKSSLEGVFTIEELRYALKNSRRGRSPGLDGLTTEFYMMFMCRFEHVLLDAINYAFTHTGCLHKSALRGMISLIPKKDRDIRRLDCLRPITILCVDYKFVEKMLAIRLRPALDLLIHHDQKGFMSDRRISCNIRRILDLMDYSDSEDLPAVIVSIDFAKCFDRIETSSLLKALSYFDFGPDFIKWTKIIYTDAVATVTNNGNLSKYFDVTRGVKQGGPCSAFYFLIIAEILAIELRKNSKIKGVLINSINRLLGQYADDLDLYLYGTAQNITSAFEVIDHYCKRTGCKINYDKTTIYRMGSLRRSQAKLYTKGNIQWSENSINILGVKVSNNEDLNKLNYKPMFKQIENIMRNWKNRGLSLFGKIMIINTLVSSLFVYKMSVLPCMPESYIKKLDVMMNDFLWDSKKPKIKLSTLQNDKYLGGAGLVNFRMKDLSLKIAWIQILQSDSMMKDLAYAKLSPVLEEKIWECNTKEVDVKKIFGQGFWSDVMLAWSKIHYKDPDTASEIYGQFIWFNSNLKKEGTPFMFVKPFKSGLEYLGQLYHSTGGLIECETMCPFFDLTVMQWNCIVSSIPKKWKNMLVNESNVEMTVNTKHQEILCKKKISSYFYKSINQGLSNLRPFYDRWGRSSDTAFQFDEFCEAFRNLYLVTNNAKLRSFQYRLLHKAVLLNERLCKWKIVQDPKCSLCTRSNEDIEHFFWSCEFAQRNWNWVRSYCAQIAPNHQCNLNYANVILNLVNDKPGHIFNFVILLTKQYMYANRCLKKNMTREMLINKIETIRRYEFYYAKQQNQLTKHCKKWLLKNDENETVYNGTSIDEYVIQQYLEEL